MIVQQTEGVHYEFNHRYHKGCGLRQVKYASGRWVRYTPDAAGRIAKVEAVDSGGVNVQKSYWDGVQYAPQGALKQVTLGNALTERWSYNAQRQQPYDVRLGATGNEGSHFRLQFAYCANNYSGGSCGTNNGNILAQWNYENNHIEQYTYDAVNRLSSATDFTAASNGWSQSYSYDRFGNRWVSANGTLPMDARTPTSESYIDATNNRLKGTNYAYDSAGNQTKHGGWTLAYDAENRLVSSQPSGGIETTFSYDGEGRRVKKTTNGVSSWFVYSAMGELAAEYLESAPSSALVTQFVTTDHLGSTRLVTDATGNVVSRHDYLPFGEEIPAGYGGRTAAMKYVSNAALTQRFTGKERDTETGLDYFGARYLSGVLGRWTGADPVMANIIRVINPQRWNLYSYAVNNPLAYSDPDGRDAVAVGSPEGAHGLGHAGIISVFKNGQAHFSHYGPQRQGSAIGKGKVESFPLSPVQFGTDGMPTSQSYQRMAAEITERTGYSPDMIQFAYFKTSDAETQSLRAWQDTTQDLSNRGTIAGYKVLSSSCRDYCLTGLYKGGATGRPGYFYFSVIPNELLQHLMRFAQGSYDAQKKERKPKEKVESRICYEGDAGCKGGK